MRIIFLSSLFHPLLVENIENNTIGNIQYAANTLQWNILEGFKNVVKQPINVITAPMIGSYPTFYKKPYIYEKTFQPDQQGVTGKSIAYLNLPLIKNYHIYFNLKKSILSIDSLTNTHIIVYGIHTPYIKAAVSIKKIIPSVKLTIIVPDLPEYMSNSNNIIWKLRELIEPHWSEDVKLFDYYILLADAMSNYLGISDHQWIRIEGMVNPAEHNTKLLRTTSSEKKIVMYAGTLAERYGILNLVNAFSLIKDNDYELWICGAGNTEEKIKEIAQSDSRIHFFGILPRDQVLKLQQKSTLLVNPRSPEGEYTKYSFPSKTMEYLLSGIPCLMYKLPGIPDEYDEHLFYFEGSTANDIKTRIIEICSLPQDILTRKATNAKNFVLHEKNIYKQTKKILDFISG